MAGNVELWMPFEHIYQPALSIPVDTCKRFSIHPLTWLRYLGYTIYGNKGHISTSPNGPEVQYYQTDILPGIYYYVSFDEPLLLDPDGIDARPLIRRSNASSISTSRHDFNSKVAARDGKCVITSSTVTCACHLIPHSRGHQYMSNLMIRRKQQLDPLLDNINDARNGILLDVTLDRLFGASVAAFLQTPNFAMTINDVDLAMPPWGHLVGYDIHPSIADRHLTLQHFNVNDPSYITFAFPHNTNAKQSNSDDWPPPFLFDFTYGCAALKAWGVERDSVKEKVQAWLKSTQLSMDS